MPLPLEDAARPVAGDLAGSFAQACAAAGGRCVRVAEAAGIEAALRALPEAAGATRIYSAHPAVAGARFESHELADPRRLAGLELAVLPGVFGVAESGAVWVDAGALPQRAVLWLAEHLVLALPAAELVPQLHAAYERLRFAAPGFGVFVAGPSKTADIEQSLVIGAQGPRSTTVLLVDGP
jgi:L-lactate dehydrogenase complex protein LldG